MLQTGELIIQRGNLNNGNLTGQTGSFTSGSLSGPTTYVSVENDPVFRGSAAYTITQSDIDRWNQDAEASTYFVSYSYLYSYVGYALEGIDVDIDLSSYVSYSYLADSLSSYVTKDELSACGYITSSDVSAMGYITQHQDLSAYVTKEYLSNQGYLTSIPSEYITEQELSECGYLTYHQSLDGLVNEDDLYTILSTYATKNYVDNAILNAEIGGEGTTVDLTYYLRKDELDAVLVSYATKAEISNAGYVTNNTLENILLSYVKKSELTNALSSYVSYSYLENKHYLTQQDLSNYATVTYVNNKDADLYAYVTYVADNLNAYINDIDLSAYVSKEELSACGYLTEHQDLSAYATKAYVVEYVSTYSVSGDIDLSSYVTKDELSACSYITMADVSACGYLTEHQSLAGYVTSNDLDTILNTYATKNYVDNAILNAEIGGEGTTIDLTYYLRKDELDAVLVSYTTKAEISAQSYVTQPALSAMGYLTQHQDLSSYASKTYVADYVADAIDGIETVTYQTSYTGNAYYISIWQGTQVQYNQLPDYTTYQLYLIAQS